jgi:UDP-N-acetylglucosamine 2-epimerase (non-hydrolysing)
VAPERIWVTGNTVIDALQIIAHQVSQEQEKWEKYFAREYRLSLDGKRLILVTGHRRKNFGPGFQNICWALREVVEAFPDVLVVYPVPPQSQCAAAGAGPEGRLALLPPLEYAPFVYLLSQSYLVLTDSGGIQEEAPALGPWANRCWS